MGRIEVATSSVINKFETVDYAAGSGSLPGMEMAASRKCVLVIGERRFQVPPEAYDKAGFDTPARIHKKARSGKIVKVELLLDGMWVEI